MLLVVDAFFSRRGCDRAGRRRGGGRSAEEMGKVQGETSKIFTKNCLKKPFSLRKWQH